MPQPTSYVFGVDVDIAKNQLLNARLQNLSAAPTGPLPGQIYFDAPTGKFLGWNGTVWVDLSQTITSAVTIKGEINNAASSPAYPTSPAVGDTYFVTTQAGTIGTSTVEIGDQLVYSNSGWFVLQRNLQASSQAIAGFIRLATQSEANTGTDATTAISPATLATFLVNFLYARKFRFVISSLVAATATTVTHGLNVANPEDIHVSFYQGGNPIQLGWQATSVNAISVISNQTYGSVTVVIIG